MFRTAFAVCAFALVYTGSLPAWADNTAAARRAIQAAYDKMDSALAHKDAKGTVAFMADKYQETSDTGQTIGRTQKLTQMRGFLAVYRSPSVKTTIETLTLKGNTATVTESDVIRFTVANPQDHAVHHVVGTDRERDTWLRTAKGWSWTRSVGLADKFTLDGKVVQHHP